MKTIKETKDTLLKLKLMIDLDDLFMGDEKSDKEITFATAQWKLRFQIAQLKDFEDLESLTDAVISGSRLLDLLKFKLN